MTPVTCNEFRGHLERALRGHPERVDTRPLAWHEHLLGCERCRAFLEAEEALEELLSSLPEPRLPGHLVTRVLARLVAHRGAREGSGLDRLLDLDDAPVAPANLAPRVLAGLSAARRSQREEERLDELLDLVPAPEVPVGLDDRVLIGLESARRPAVRLRFLAGGTGKKVAAAAAVLVLGLVAWRLFFGKAVVAPEAPAPDTLVDAELIASLDVLDQWPLLMSDDPYLQLASISPFEEALLDARVIDDTEDPGVTSEDDEG